MSQDRLQVTLSVPADTPISELVTGDKRLVEISQTDTTDSKEPQTHKFSVGDFALDKQEPTPSPEANTVEILELTNTRADEYYIEDVGMTVAEYNPFYGDSSPVVIGHYPNMGSDKEFAFPESRLQEV